MTSNISFSFAPLLALALWSLPAFIAIILTWRWRGLSSVSGFIAQSSATYLISIIVVESILGFAGLLNYTNTVCMFIFLLIFVVVFSGYNNVYTILREVIQRLNIQKIRLLVIDRLGGFAWFFVPIALVMIAHAIRASSLPPVHIDCLWSYLPEVVGWLQTQTLFEHRSPLSFYHNNSLLITLWTILPFNTDQFVNLQNLPSALLIIATFYNILKMFEIDRRLCLLLGVAFITLPQVNYFLWNQKVDIMLTAFFILSLNFLYEYIRSGKNPSLVYSLICAGIVAGTKTFGLLYGLLLYAAILYVGIRERQQIKLFVFIIGSLLCLIFALVWPIRNWMIWGNPFYPMSISLFGVQIFGGPGFSGRDMGVMFSSSIVTSFQLDIIPIFLKGSVMRFGMLGIGAILSLFTAIAVIVRRREKIYYINMLGVIIIISFLIYILLPVTGGTAQDHAFFIRNYQNMYYGMPFFALAPILLIIHLSKLKPFVNLVLVMILILQISLAQIQTLTLHQSNLLMVQALIFTVICLIYPLLRINQKMQKVFVGLLIVAIVSFIWGGLYFKAEKYRLEQRYKSADYVYFTGVSPDILQYINNYTGGENILLLPLSRGFGVLPYPFYGHFLNNKIFLTDSIFEKSYRPQNNIDIVVVTGKKRENSIVDSLVLPQWTEEWGKNNGFKIVKMNKYEIIFKRI